VSSAQVCAPPAATADAASPKANGAAATDVAGAPVGHGLRGRLASTSARAMSNRRLALAGRGRGRAAHKAPFMPKSNFTVAGYRPPRGGTSRVTVL
jgi:hypothetical protein